MSAPRLHLTIEQKSNAQGYPSLMKAFVDLREEVVLDVVVLEVEHGARLSQRWLVVLGDLGLGRIPKFLGRQGDMNGIGLLSRRAFAADQSGQHHSSAMSAGQP